MKILLGVHKFFPEHRTGTEVLTLEIARGLRQRGHVVEIIAGAPHPRELASRPAWLSRDEYDGFQVHRLNFGQVRLRDPIGLQISAPQRMELVREVVSSLRPDLVHFTHLRSFSSRIIPEIQRMGIPVLFTPTDFWTVCPLATLFRPFEDSVCNDPADLATCLRCCRPMPGWAARLGIKLAGTPLRKVSGAAAALHSLSRRLPAIVADVNTADRIMPATRFLAEVLIRHGVDPGKIDVVPYGVDIGHLPEKADIPKAFRTDRTLRLGFIGTLSAVKGAHVIVEALAMLGKEGGTVSLDIYGKAEPSDPYLRQLEAVAARGKARVCFRGTFPHEEIGAVLRGVHILIVPSTWYESTPLVLCSALAAGTFVLVSDLGGMTEVVTEGENGFSFKAGDPADLARLFRQILAGAVDLSHLPPDHLVRRRTTADYVCDVENEYVKAMKGRNFHDRNLKSGNL